MAIRTSYKACIGLTGKDDIIRVISPTGDEPDVFNPFYGFTDETVYVAHAIASFLECVAEFIFSAAC
jgi:hypothetical protein